MSLDNVFNVTVVLTIVQMIPMLVMVWIGIIAAGGLLKKKHSKPVLRRKGRTDFGIIICAHNEENAIGSLFESIAAQDYDQKKIQVFLLADHCTDDTVRIGKKYSFVTVFERQDEESKGKGAVLHWGLERILKTEAGKNADAFAVIDADNVLKADFLSKMDRKLREGNQIVQGNRLGGQPYRSIVTKWYTMYWACYTVFFSYAREKLGLSAFLTGTGFAVDADILRSEGWNTGTITEDVEFSISNILMGRRVAFCVEAVLYDEQPYQFRVMFNQIGRWCTGGYQVLRKYGKSLLSWKKSETRSIQKFDTLMLLLMGPCSWIAEILSVLNRIVMYFNLPLYFFVPFAFAGLLGLIGVYVGRARYASL
jgi:cellulose synthase/poly-beta-1,6-N-acetylglucosamine synthase-like glycosyltransferase